MRGPEPRAIYRGCWLTGQSCSHQQHEAGFVVYHPTTVAEVTVTADLLRKAVSAIHQAPKDEGATLEGCVKAITEVLLDAGIEEQQELVDLGSAICARLMAFAGLLNSQAAEPWLTPIIGRAGLSIDRPLLEAVAIAPLMVKRGRYQFDKEIFFAIVLDRAPVAGCG